MIKPMLRKHKAPPHIQNITLYFYQLLLIEKFS